MKFSTLEICTIVFMLIYVGAWNGNCKNLMFTIISFILAKLHDFSDIVGSATTVFPLLRDHPRIQQKMVSLRKWSSTRGGWGSGRGQNDITYIQ